MQLGEGRGPEALAPGGAEGHLLRDRLPTQTEARDGGVTHALVGEALHAAGGVQLERVDPSDPLCGTDERQRGLDVSGAHTAAAAGDRHGRALIEQLDLGALVAEALLAPLGAEGHGDRAGGQREQGARRARVDGGEFRLGVAGHAALQPGEGGRVVADRGAVGEEIERGGAIGVRERGVDLVLAGEVLQVEVRGLAVPGDGGVPGPAGAEAAVEAGDEAGHLAGGGGEAVTQLEETEEHRLRGIGDEGHAERVERVVRRERDCVEGGDRRGGEALDVFVALPAEFGERGHLGGERVAQGRDETAALGLGLRADGGVGIERVLRLELAGERGVRAGGVAVDGERACGRGGAGGDHLAGDRIGGTGGHHEGAGGVARQEQLALHGLREFPEQKRVAAVPVADEGEGGGAGLCPCGEGAAEGRGADAPGEVAVGEAYGAAGEVALEDDVHDAGHRIGPVDGGGAVLEDLDARDGGHRDHVHVHELLRAEAGGGTALTEGSGGDAAAVEEDEGGVDAEAAQGDGGGAGGGGVDAVLGEALGADLRDLAQQVGEVELARGFDLGGGDHAQVGGAGGLTEPEVGTRDHDGLELGGRAGGGRGGGLGRVRPGQGGRGDHRKQQGGRAVLHGWCQGKVRTWRHFRPPARVVRIRAERVRSCALMASASRVRTTRSSIRMRPWTMVVRTSRGLAA